MRIGELIDLIGKHTPSISDLTKVRDLIPKRRVSARRERCIGCGACARKLVCPVKAVSIKNQKVSIDHSRCLGCGHCILACRRGALVMGLSPRRV